jgi:hypothetical protein
MTRKGERYFWGIRMVSHLNPAVPLLHCPVNLPVGWVRIMGDQIRGKCRWVPWRGRTLFQLWCFSASYVKCRTRQKMRRQKDLQSRVHARKKIFTEISRQWHVLPHWVLCWTVVCMGNVAVYFCLGHLFPLCLPPVQALAVVARCFLSRHPHFKEQVGCCDRVHAQIYRRACFGFFFFVPVLVGA